MPDSKPQSGNVTAASQNSSAKTFTNILEIIKTILWILLWLAVILLPFIAVILAKYIRRKKRASIYLPEASIAAGWLPSSLVMLILLTLLK
ncbi:MAG: hypothetical protein LBM13_03475 [Candidatus Ancillula sp.]|nr:hypothetical protein [Candidatus Ancillula sp.]